MTNDAMALTLEQNNLIMAIEMCYDVCINACRTMAEAYEKAKNAATTNHGSLSMAKAFQQFANGSKGGGKNKNNNNERGGKGFNNNNQSTDAQYSNANTANAPTGKGKGKGGKGAAQNGQQNQSFSNVVVPQQEQTVQNNYQG